jgi:hypothetical protein
MKDRCKNPRNKDAAHYHDRGISVIPEWDGDYTSFRDWALGAGYEPGLEIDRIDNDGHYEPANCRWVTRRQNVRNLRRNRLVTAFGETRCLTDWASDPRCRVSRTSLGERIRAGWDHESAITTLPRSA